jgi:hypothetical protein
MKTYPVGVAVTVTIPLVDFNGDPVTPTGLSYVVYNENDEEVVEETALDVTEGMTDAEITVPGDLNTVVEGAPAGIRTVVLQIDVEGGSFRIDLLYKLRANVPLVLLKNSFQTYAGAQLLASEMTRMFGWDGADDATRQAALVEAYERLTRVGYRVRRPQDIDFQNTVGELNDLEDIIEPRSWPVLQLTRWQNLPDHFKRALKRAQVLEANEILRGDKIGEKRRSGLMSESIGESSMMFRPGKPLQLGISAPALEALTGYINIRMTLTRS